MKSGVGSVKGGGRTGRLATGRQNALINFPLGPKSQAERGRGASVLWAGRVLWRGTKFMWAARRRSRRRQNFCIEFERAKQFRFFLAFIFFLFFIYPFSNSAQPSATPPTFFSVSVFIRGRGEGRTKQKDFAAKAYGFLVSCYYFIWPQSEFESESAFASHSQSWSGSGTGSCSDMQLLQRPKPERGTLATDNCKRGA